jgi:hypothetical protein
MFACSRPVAAQEAPADPNAEAQNLAKQLSNPIANLVSIPFQFNWENGVGVHEDLRFVLNVQPVVPFSLGEDWNLIGRLILPFVNQPAGLAPGTTTASGTSDIVLSAFFSPTKGDLVWGIGPVLGLPTTTDPLLGSGKWSAGPTAVVLKQAGPWTVGALANHLWSYANTGDYKRYDVSTTLVQPFLSYGTKGGITFSLNTESTYNWEADSGEEWTVPVNLSVSKITKLGPFPFSVQAGGGPYAKSPEGGPEWKLRTSFTLILPKARGN